METQDPVQSVKERGNKELQAGNYLAAIELYSSGINMDEENHILYSNRSVAYGKIMKWKEALDDANKTIQLAPSWSKGYIRKGLALHHLGRFAESKVFYQKALNLEPGNEQVLAALQDVIRAEQNPPTINPPIPEPPPTPEKNPEKPPENQFHLKIPNNFEIYPPKSTTPEPKSPHREETTSQYYGKSPRSEQKSPRSPRREEGSVKTPHSDRSARKSVRTENSEKPEKLDSSREVPPKGEEGGQNVVTDNGRERVRGDKEKANDVDYYLILGITKEATSAQIKKAYYQKARDFHPDKNAENPDAEEMFKLISEAYTVLMDEEKRKLYDKYGIEAVRASEQGAMDPAIIFKMIFGGGSFDDIFGELSFSTMAQDAMEAMEGLQNGLTEAEIMQKAEQAFHKRKDVLVTELLKKLDPHIAGSDPGFKSQSADIQEKLESPGGPALLKHVSYIYIQEAKKNLGRFLGVESFFAGLEETGHAFKQTFSLLSSVVKFQVAQDRFEQEGQQNEHLANEMMSHGLSSIWMLGKVEIERMVREVCQTILKVPDKKLKKLRAAALKELGEVYRNEIREAKKKGLAVESPFETIAKELDEKEKEKEKEKEPKGEGGEKEEKEKLKNPKK